MTLGVSTNLILWVWAENIHWMWWNVFGFFITSSVALIVSSMNVSVNGPSQKQIRELTLSPNEIVDREWKWMPIYGFLVLYFIFIMTFVMFLN